MAATRERRRAKLVRCAFGRCRDEGCNYAIQQGCQLSRAHLGTFRQNDPGDLDAAIDKMERRLKGRPLTRRFVVVEGLYQDWGDLSPLR